MKKLVLIFGLFIFSLTVNSQTTRTWPSGLDSARLLFYNLTYSLIEKFNANKLAEVETDVATLKLLIPNYTTDSNYTNALHKVNIIEGRLALKMGNVPKASEYLLKAGEVIVLDPSPQLKAFGPNMSLAKELLEAGEREPVLEYFKICKKMWTGQISQWENQVINGKIPDFKANLFY